MTLSRKVHVSVTCAIKRRPRAVPDLQPILQLRKTFRQLAQ